MRWDLLNDSLHPGASLIVVLAVAIVLRLLWRRLFVREHDPTRLAGWIAEHTATPVFLLVIAAGAQVIFARLLRVSEIRKLPLTPYIDGAIYVVTVLSVTWVFYGLAKGLSDWYLMALAPRTSTVLDSEVVRVFRLIVKIVLISVAATVVLDRYNVHIRTLLGAAGVLSLVLALAAQDTLANLFAGFTILADRPFRVGDRIELSNGRVGDVQDIGLRSTKILSFENTLYIIPNAELAKSSIVNLSYPGDKINVRQKLSLPYGNDIDKVKQVVVEACRAHPAVLHEPPPAAMVTDWGDALLQMTFNFWIADYRARAQVVDEIDTAIYARLLREGIRMKDQLGEKKA